jgi:uncharacterized membrane protein YgaE (UPF0421/DUF939 family)
MRYRTKEDGEELFFSDKPDVKIIVNSFKEQPAKIAASLLQMKAIEETEGDIYKIFEAVKAYQKLREKLEMLYQKYRIFKFLKEDKQYLRLRDCTQDDIRSAYEEKDAIFFYRLCNGILFND